MPDVGGNQAKKLRISIGFSKYSTWLRDRLYWGISSTQEQH
jgi:hypothetical protein